MTTVAIPFDHAVKLYYRLNAIYGSPYSDKPDEMNQAIHTIHQYLNAGVRRTTFLNKMEEMMEREGSYKSKLSTHIANHFWEKQFAPRIPQYKYVIEE